jgi:hypothetical protein
MSENEWYGEPHTLIVHEVEPLSGDEDPGYRELDYDLEHPPSCTKRVYTYEFACFGGESPTVEEWDCDLAQHEAEAGLAGSLSYSGTPVTEPGTYRIQSWGRKTYYPSAGAYEYDGGVGLVEPEEATV